MSLHSLKKVLSVLGLAPWLLCASSIWAENGGGEEEVLRATLENGLRVVIVRNTLAPVVTTIINYMVGSNEAPEGFPGMAHAQEHMMFRGSPGLSANQLAGIIAVLGGRFNADTQQTVTQYFLTAPAEDLDVALHIEAVRMRGVLDSERLWAQERGAIEQEVAQDLSNPEYVFYTKLLAHMFKGTPYAHTPLGTVSSFNQTTGAMLKQFYDTWYAPNNALLVIVGDVQTRKALEEVKKLFAGIPAKKIPERPPIQLEPVTAEAFPLKTDLSYGLVMISFRFPGYDSEDYPATQVLADVLSNQRGNLFALVPEGKALYAGFTLSPLPKAGLGYAVAAFPKGADPSSLVKEVRRVLEEDAQKGFPADLVEAAKRNKLTQAELKKNSVFGLAMAWSQALAVEGQSSPEEGVKAIQKVTVSDVNRVARKYLNLDQAVVAVLTPEPSGKPVPAQAHRAVESFTPKATGPAKLPEWAEKSLGRISVPASRVNPQITVLPNGLKLMVQPESVSNTVSVYGYVKNTPDLEAPQGKEGVDQVLNQLFSFGTTSLDRRAFQKALDDIGAKAAAGPDFFVQALASEFELGVRLLADNVLRPALPEGAFKTVQRQAAASVAGLLESPEYLAERALKAALFPPNDPTLRQATPATISSLTLRDVKDYYRRIFRPDLTSIVVIGKVTAEEAKAVIEKHFGSWTASGPKPETLLPPVAPSRPSSTAVPDQSRVQDKVTLAETLGLNRANPDYYALQLGNHVLGGAFYATRLYQGLREKSGLVYYVGSSFDVGQTRAIYMVNYACDPQNVSRARDIVEQNLKRMHTAPVTPQELHQAKALLLREIPLSEASVDNIAQGLIYRASHELPLDEPTRAAHQYLKLTAEHVQAAFARWVRPNDLVQITEGPTPK
ncbi:MAG TPA: pitrilysin family protein [Thermodesulfobacteriota bacterium]|nr:pitrilysin family protein [Thermodesulfobacteriota bacterium]